MTDDPRMLQWRNLPMELRLKRQWLVANPANKNPLFHKQNQFYNASVSRHASSQWMSFEEATAAALAHNLAIGFVIMEGEDITCIDLDVKPDTTRTTLDLFESVVKQFDTYTERSLSGRGIHVWCKGSIGLGRRRDGVEIYSQNRFMICTGNTLHRRENLESRQDLLNGMVSQMSLSDDASEIVLEELPQVESDEEVGRKLWENDDARMLWQGMWRELDHPSQSEGDMDLMVHLVRLSPSNEQCKRLFRQSGLGKRQKANRNDYILRTLRHARLIRQNELVDIELGKRTAEAIAAKYDAEQMKVTSDGTVAVDFYTVDSFEQTFVSEPTPQLAEPEEDEFQLGFPPGGFGYLTGYFYRGSRYPNVQFSVAAALTVMSGICGRAWNNSTNSGLNTYNLVVAPSGMGKDEMSDGINRLKDLCCAVFPGFDKFFYFGRFASGQGLAKYFGIGKNCFAQIIPEFGDQIKKFANGRDENAQGLMTVMLGLFSKSGPNATSDGLIYSDATKNVAPIKSPSYTFLADTTPEVFESVNAFLLNNGFISRFNIFEYHGKRSDRNKNVDYQIDPNFIEHLVMLARVADRVSTEKGGKFVASLDSAAQSRYDSFEKFCDTNYHRSIQNRGQEIEHHMWSRSLNRVNILATLAAILDAPPVSPQGHVHPPIVTEAHWDYFERMVMNDINNFKTKQEAGDLGGGHNAQIKKIEALLEQYLNGKIPISYGIPPELPASRKIPYSHIRLKMTQQACFRTDGNFDDKKLKDAIQILISTGKLGEIKDPNQKTVRGALYWIY